MYLRYLLCLTIVSCLPKASITEIESSSSAVPLGVVIEAGVSQDENQEAFIINYNNPTFINDENGTFTVVSNKFICPTSFRNALIEFCGNQCDALSVQGAYILSNNSGYKYIVTLKTSLQTAFNITIPSLKLYTLDSPLVWYNNSLTFQFQVNPSSSNPSSSNPSSSNPSSSNPSSSNPSSSTSAEFILTYVNPFVVANDDTRVKVISNTKICPYIFQSKINLACQGKCKVTGASGYITGVNEYTYYFQIKQFTELPLTIEIPPLSLSCLENSLLKYQSPFILEFTN